MTTSQRPARGAHARRAKLAAGGAALAVMLAGVAMAPAQAEPAGSW